LSLIRRYRVADVEIDLGAREIRRAGLRVDVEAKVFDLIELLLLARGRALTKAELVSALWGGRPVTDAALSQQLRKARRALGDDGDAQRVIRTVHGRGLLWVAEVVEAEVIEAEVTEAAVVEAEDVAVPPRVAQPEMPPVVDARWTPRTLRWLSAAAVGALLLVAGMLRRASAHRGAPGRR
jgi:DNA-binding winged helix-turn-helix (wHTH) protein